MRKVVVELKKKAFLFRDKIQDGNRERNEATITMKMAKKLETHSGFKKFHFPF